MKEFKKLLSEIGNLFVWLFPLSVFLVALLLPVYLLKLNFSQFLEFIKILVWPATVLIILFFFRKVVTYLFFSMDEFNFFGVKGSLRNVNDIIEEKVKQRFLDEKKEKERKEEINRFASELNTTKGTAEEYLRIAKDIFSGWKKSDEDYQRIVANLKNENSRLRAQIPPSVSSGIINVSPEKDMPDSETGGKIEDLPLTNPKTKNDE